MFAIPDYQKMIFNQLDYPDLINYCKSTPQLYEFCKTDPDLMKLKRDQYIREKDAEYTESYINTRVYASRRILTPGKWIEIFLSACINGRIDIIKYIIEFHPIDPTLYNQGIYKAALYCHSDIVEFLLAQEFLGNYFLIHALKASSRDCGNITIRLLQDDRVIEMLRGSHRPVIELLLKSIDRDQPDVIKAILDIPGLFITKPYRRLILDTAMAKSRP